MKSVFVFKLLTTIMAVFAAFTVMAPAGETDDETLFEDYTIKVVVTATKGEIPAREVAGSIDVITERQIEQRQQTTVLELLRTIPSLDVVQSGGPGRQTSVFMRGAKPEHTLVIIDGVSMGDPMSTAGAYDFGYLTTDNIERIEILRGNQSTLYGSAAIGGVINIITKKGKGETNGFLSLEGGSYETFTESGGVNGGGRWVNYSLGFSRQDSEGISEIRNGVEKDGYGNTSFSGRLGITPAKTVDLGLIFRRVDAKADMDGSSDDPNNIMQSRQHFLRAQGRFDLFKGFWNMTAGFSLGDTNRYYRNDVDADHPLNSDESAYAGRTYKFDWQNDFRLHQTNMLTFGLETEKEQGDYEYHSVSAWGPYDDMISDVSTRTTGYYFQDQIRLWNAWFTTVGFRVEDHSKFGTKSTWNVSSAYVVDKTGTKLKMSFGTGFKAPSLYQLHSQYGFEELDPEESAGWETGVEQAVVRGVLSAGATYFSNDFDNMIDFDMATYRYSNVARARSKGFEVSLNSRPAEGVVIQGNYTFTETRDLLTGQALLRRAKHKFGVNVNYEFMKNADINLNLRYAGKRPDVEGIWMDGYATTDLAGSYKLTNQVKLFGRVENLFNCDYEEISGYGTRGISAYGGIRVTF
ncbi:MAG: TonB-dependent receptor [Acidobacteria bacterium]|nr:TonB-dependent receptor [Acidobacteriota bacterium]